MGLVLFLSVELEIVGIVNFRTCSSFLASCETFAIEGRFLSRSENNDQTRGYENVAVRPLIDKSDRFASATGRVVALRAHVKDILIGMPGDHSSRVAESNWDRILSPAVSYHLMIWSPFFSKLLLTLNDGSMFQVSGESGSPGSVACLKTPTALSMRVKNV